ncbi:MAG: ferritin [Bacteroidales bacterium]|nr:ferritin [Bacteroidales bacterium]
MISDKMQDALNAQINNEMWSAYLYLAMSADVLNFGMKGMSHWFRKQTDEEMQHAFKFMDYLESHFASIELRAIAEIPIVWENPESMFETALRNERKVTSLINNLCLIAENEKDYATIVFLQWFVTEQVEEEESVRTILDDLTKIGEDKAALFLLDKELEKR